MARSRLVKPDFFKHRALYQAELASRMPLRLAFEGLWLCADREGRFRWKEELKLDILPYDAVDFLAVLDALERFGFIVRYAVSGRDYGWIPTFLDHQTPHHTERKSVIPPYPGPKNGEVTVSSPEVHGEPPAGSVVEVSSISPVWETDTGSVAARPGAADDAADPALRVCVAINRAVAARFGERPSPYTVAQCQKLAETTGAVPSDVLTSSLERQCLTLAKPPRHPNYFGAGIAQDWEEEQARRAVAATGPVTPLPPVLSGEAVFRQLQQLVERRPVPGQPTAFVLRRAAVEGLGPRAVAAYDAIGGARRLAATIDDPRELGFLAKEFAKAYAAA